MSNYYFIFFIDSNEQKEHGIVYTKEENFMCTKLKELSELTVEKIYDKYGDFFNCPPIDIEGLLKILGVSFVEQDFAEITGQIGTIKLPEQSNEVFGAVSATSDENDPSKDEVKISVNKFDSYNRKRFTLAHELGHCMHDANSLKNGFIELRSSTNGTDPKEVLINRIAAEILIPKKLLELEYNKMYIPVLQILANKFKVSTNVMRVRLEELDMEYVSV